MNKNFYQLVFTALIFTAAQSALAARPNINFCGTTLRTGANLYSGMGAMTESQSCAPDANTQAMFVSRDGTTAGNGAAWLSYLNAGGVIITEFSKGAAVYNEIYGTSIADGTFKGSCQDNVMPAVKLTPSDPFWSANPGLTETGATVQGCGFDLTAAVTFDNTITPLGGFDGGGVQLARKVQGSGVLFLLEADWQDNESGAGWTASSASLMTALTNGGTPAVVAAPAPASIPTLSEWAMIFLASLMGLFAFARIRRQN